MSILAALCLGIVWPASPDTFAATGNAYQIVARYGEQFHSTVLLDGGFSNAVAEVSASGSKTEILNKIAERIDCSVEVTKSGVPLLMRRFRRDAEFPQADRELVQAAREIVADLRTLKYAMPDPDHRMWPVMLKKIASECTPIQIAALRDGRALKLSQLNAAQRHMLEAAVQTRAFGGIQNRVMLAGRQLEFVQDAKLRTLPSRQLESTYDCRLITAGPGWSGALTIAMFPGPKGELDIQAPDISRASLAASGSPAAATGHGLSASVSLTAGTRSVGELFELLATQAGVRISVAEAVKERKIFAIVAGTPLRDVLDGVVQLYGWRWFEKDDGELVVGRQSRRPPSRTSDVAASVRAALPVDVRRYFAIPVGDEVAPFDVDTHLRQRALADAATKKLWKLLADHNGFGSDLEMAKLTPSEQEAVRLLLLARTIGPIDDRAFWRNEFGVHDIEPSEAELTLTNEGVLMVTYRRPGAHAGFGTNVRNEIQ